MIYIALIILFLLALGGALAAKRCNCRKQRAEEQPIEQSPGTQEGSESAQPAEPFLIKPFLQPGTNYGAKNAADMEIVWHSIDAPDAFWYVIVRSCNELRHQLGGHSVRAQITAVDVPAFHNVPAHKQHRALVTGRKSGEAFSYDVYLNGTKLLSGTTTAPKAAGEPLRFVVVGDIGENSAGQKKIAHQVLSAKPDFVAVPGDMVYKRGRLSEYLEKFFPIMNHEEDSPETGAPLLRSAMFVFAPGNHDVGRPDLLEVPNLDTYPDLFAYFYLWSQPLNGPINGGTANVQTLVGEAARQEAFLQAAAGRYPSMAQFSYDYGDTHWLVLDANLYMDWTNEELRAWVRNDLNSTSAVWKFVMFHQPGFTSHRRHRVEQRMRLLADIFQECSVDIAFVGHAHWYERTYPLKFTVKPQPDGSLISKSGAVDGEFVLDKSYDGIENTRPNGVLYLVTGGGGAKLQWIDLPADGKPEEFTHKLVWDRYSYSLVETQGKTLTLRQIDENGNEFDRLVITKQ